MACSRLIHATLMGPITAGVGGAAAWVGPPPAAGACAKAIAGKNKAEKKKRAIRVRFIENVLLLNVFSRRSFAGQESLSMISTSGLRNERAYYTSEKFAKISSRHSFVAFVVNVTSR